MSKARDLANAGTALTTVSATELGYLDGVTSAVQTQINSKEATLPSQTGNSGKYLTTDGTNKSWGTVNTPTTWTIRATSTTGNINAFAYNGSNMYVAAGESGTLYSSPDGITWTSRTSQFSTSIIYDVSFGNGLFVAVGASGKISTSPDGITWTARTANMSTNAIIRVLYDNSIWVAIGAGGGTTNTGGITYSTDGLTWTRKSQSLTVGPSYETLVWNGTNWIVGSNISTNNYLYATTPSGTWTVGNATGGNGFNSIYWDGTRHIFSHGDGNWYYTTSGTTLASTAVYSNVPSGSWSWNNAKYYSGKIYLAAAYMQNFTTSGVAKPPVGPITFSPSTTMNTAGTLSSTAQTLGVFSTGQLFSDSRGNIYTSF